MSLWRSLTTNNVKSVHAKARNDCSDECKCKIICQSYKKHKEKERKESKDLTNHQSWWTPVTPSWLVELTLVDKIDQLCHVVYHSRDGGTRTPSTSVICPIVIYCPLVSINKSNYNLLHCFIKKIDYEIRQNAIYLI